MPHRYGLTLLLLVLLLPPPSALQAADELILGIFPRRSATQTIELFSPLARYLEHALGRPVRLETAKDFETFWQGVETGRFDLVHYNQYHYIQSSEQYRVIACNEEQGKDTIAGALYVRSDSGISEISQLRGRKIIYGGGADAMMSHIVPHYLLLQYGLSEKHNDYTAIYASNPLNAVLGVYYRQADAGGAGDVVMHLPRIRNITEKGSLRYLAVSDPIMHLPWAVRRNMPNDLQQRLQALMLGLSQESDGKEILGAAHLTGLSRVEDSDYDSARRIIDIVINDEPVDANK